jgi:hypothetical protein
MDGSTSKYRKYTTPIEATNRTFGDDLNAASWLIFVIRNIVTLPPHY